MDAKDSKDTKDGKDTKAAAPAKTKAYRALTPIDHDNKPYAIGKTLRLDDETAKPLLAVSAIEPAGKDADDAA